MKLKQKQALSTEIQNKLVDALQFYGASQFANLHVLLRVALSLPITSYECEKVSVN